MHLGLPKTATTTFQTDLFPNLSGVFFAGKYQKAQGDLHRQLVYSHYLFETGRDFEKQLDKWAEAVQESGEETILISDESFMKWRSPRKKQASSWLTQYNPAIDEPRYGSHPIAEFLGHIKQRLPEENLLAILSIRNQSDYMASLAAQSGFNLGNLSDHILSKGDASLHFFDIVQDTSDVLGANNLLVIVYEEGVIQNSKQVLNFISANYQGELFLGSQNIRKIGDREWVSVESAPTWIILILNFLRRFFFGRLLVRVLKLPAFYFLFSVFHTPKVISITEDERRLVREKFRVQNRLLANFLDKDLMGLGY